MADIFNISVKDTQDVIKLNQLLHKRKAKADICYVATELAQNIVNAKTTAHMKINGQSVESIVTGNKFKQADGYTKLAKYAFSKKEETSLKDDDNISSSGRGLLSIFYAGWDINVEPVTENSYKITATKLANS